MMPPNLSLIYPYCEKCKLAKLYCICLKYNVMLALQREDESEQRRQRDEERQRRIEEYRLENQRRLDLFHQTQILKIKELHSQVEQIKIESRQIDCDKERLIEMKLNVIKMLEAKDLREEIKEKSIKVLNKIEQEIEKKVELLSNLANQLDNCSEIEKLMLQKYETLRDQYNRQFEEFKRQVLNQNE